jgi:tRNA-binding EMAP/Myf-like protein
MATIDEFHKIEMKIGKIISAERIEGADKLLKLMVDFGFTTFNTNDGETSKAEQVADIRQILSGIAEWYQPEDLIGKLCPFVTNLPTRTMRGLESQGMILAVGVGDSAVLLHPDKAVELGSKLR